MPLPRFQQAHPAEGAPSERHATHYFDGARGDVAALHARIEQGFADYSCGAMPHSPVADRLEAAIQMVSRSAGIVGLAVALALIGIVAF